MVYRYTGVAAAAILAFSFFELNALLRPTTDGPPWQFVVLAGLALGAIITSTGLTYRLRTWAIAVINAGALVVVSFRIATPDTLLFLIPTADSFAEMGDQLSQAMAIIRNGIEPVLPVSGLVVIITAVFWLVGAVTAYALVRGRPALALVPGLVMALQFATMDRSPTSFLQVAVFVLLLAGAVLAVGTDERTATGGRMIHKSGRQPMRQLVGKATGAALAVTLLGSMVAVGALRDRVPYDGVLSWRVPTGLTGEFFGSVSYNPFVGIQQSLVTNTTTPLFYARVDGDLEPDRVYFRLLTLETYGGGQFFADRPEVEALDTEQWEEPGHAFAGATANVTTDIVIDRLQMDWLPAAYAPGELNAEDTLASAIRVRKDDGSLRLDGGLSYPEMVYSVTSEIPQPNLDVLAADASGNLSPLFETAETEGNDVPTPLAVPVRELPPKSELYLQLPEDLDPGIGALAREKTANLETAFEAGLALEAWFRSSDFRYTTDIDPGHGATDLAEWLLEENADSPFHRAGYCENFATSMAVMARTLDIPSRVVLGFTPGERTVDDDVVVVRDRNAHAWVELWLPAQGWVRFDPTPRPDRINPATTVETAESLGFDIATYIDAIPDNDTTFDPTDPRFFDPAEIPDEDFDIDPSAFEIPVGGGSLSLPPWAMPLLVILLGGVLMLGGLPLVKWFRHRRRMARLERGDVTAAWEEIVAQLTDYGDEPAATLTPQEVAASVDPAMQPLAQVYGRAVYGPPGALNDSHVAVATRSLQSTSDRLAGRYSRTQRLVRWYRPASLLPESLRRRRRRS